MADILVTKAPMERKLILENTTSTVYTHAPGCGHSNRVSISDFGGSHTFPADEAVVTYKAIESLRGRKSNWRPHDCVHRKMYNSLGAEIISAGIDRVSIEMEPLSGCLPDCQKVTSIRRGFVAKPGADLSVMNEGEANGICRSILPTIEQVYAGDKIAQLDTMALHEMSPKLEGGFDLPVFLNELGDVATMWRELNGAIGLIPGAASAGDSADLAAREFREYVRRHPDYVHYASGSWLSANFGWLPFLGDTYKILESMMNWKQNLQAYLKLLNKRMTLHYEKVLAPETFGVPDSQIWEDVWDLEDRECKFFCNAAWPDKLTLAGRIDYSVQEMVYHATLDAAWRLPSAMDGLLAKLLGSADYWGFNLQPAQVWEMVPFSFVVDWVFPIGRILETYGDDFSNLQPRLEVNSFCRSVKTRGTRTLNLIYANARSGETSEDLEPTDAHHAQAVTNYYRVAAEPLLSRAWPDMRLPSGAQVVTASALAYELF